MKHFRKDINPRKILTLFLTMAMLITLFVGSVPQIAKAEENRTETKKIINIAFDNSGSMFWTQKYKPMKSWCRAKYAMEVFASMMNEQDELKIFPINPVSTGSSPKGSVQHIVMNKQNATEKISNMATVNNENYTSFHAVQSAYNDLKKAKNSENSEKVLIILSDGAFTKDGTRKTQEKSKILSELNKIASDSSIKVYYFGIGSKAMKFNDDESKFKSYLASDTKDTTDKLVDICNDIFSRSSITTTGEKRNKIKSNISMKRIIVFNQGRNAKINSLKDKNGKEIQPIDDGKKLAYNSNPGAIVDRPGIGLSNDGLYDRDLSGIVTTYENLKAGEYTLDYTGDNVQIFYEVDVKVMLTLKDKSGNEFKSPFKGVNPGDYKLKAKILDNQTGKDVTGSNLIKIKELSVDVVQDDGQSKTFELEKNDGYTGNIKLKENEKTKLLVHGTYSGNNEKIQYTIDNKTDSSGKSFAVTEIMILKLDTNQDYYTIGSLEKGDSIVANLTYGGKELTDEQLANVKITPKAEGLDFSEPKIISGKSAYEFKIKYKDGKKSLTKTGDYVIKVNANYKNGLAVDNKETTIEIGTIPRIVIYLMWILGILILALIIAFFTLSKALPKGLTVEYKNGKCVSFNGEDIKGIHPVASQYIDKKGFPYKKEALITIGVRKFTIPGTILTETAKVTLRVQAESPIIKPSRKRKYKIVEVRAGNAELYKVKINGISIEYVEGKGLQMKSPIKSRLKNSLVVSKEVPEEDGNAVILRGNIVAR